MLSRGCNIINLKFWNVVVEKKKVKLLTAKKLENPNPAVYSLVNKETSLKKELTVTEWEEIMEEVNGSDERY
jgi:hypothetical protein